MRSLRLLTVLAGAVAAVGCGSPRPVEQAADACIGCHGDASNGNAAPPSSVSGATSTAERRVGAHQRHLHDGALRKAIGCAECHAVPATIAASDHIDKARADLTWGPLAVAAGTATSSVTSDGDLTCTNYCHGATLRGGALTSPSWTTVDGTQASCGACHGIPPPPPHPSVAAGPGSCARCHPGTVRDDGSIDVVGGLHVDGKVEVSLLGCTTCHGDPERTPGEIAPAPPLDTRGNASQSAPGVGAHQRHLVGGGIRSALACSECHVVPGDLAHASQPLDLTWGTLARAGGIIPSWDPAALTCVNYCHGAKLGGGTLTAPVWTAGATQAQCGTCHGIPPPSATGHPTVAANPTACAACHPDTVRPDGTIDLAGGKHVNGAIDVVAGSCTACHGDPNRTPASIAAAPPRDVHGNTATSAPGVGAHQTHLVGGTIRAALACDECHAVPGDLAHASQPLDLTWGALARAGGVTPSFDPGALTCINYCHGATLGGGTLTAPVWIAGATQAQCGACHGIPPPAATGHPAVAADPTVCAGCHPDTVRPDGTIDVAGGKHVNGLIDVAGGACTACHGDPNRTPAAIAAAPPRDTHGNTATTSPGVGAHQTHLTDQPWRVAMLCSDCHLVPGSAAHATQPLDLTWGPLARTGGVTPTWDAATLTCTNYCHGASLSGGSNPTPIWTGGSDEVICRSCHGLPPSTGQHQHVFDFGVFCFQCHGSSSVNGFDPGTHVNGTVNVGGATSSIVSWTAPTCVSTCHDPRTW